MGSAPEMDEDARSDVSEQMSQRTGSVLSDTGGLDAADGPSDPRPGTSQVNIFSLMFCSKMRVLFIAYRTYHLILVLII